ncbi:carbon-nitrogen hydrolase [Pseudovirgaria hyperparasitica]|uniref:Carbon-nitrogen hydrolase n=1 Tax=Pseudovirgaria hyperparasitica TaxID=470096 RepID=A0A6A6W070_9PEZI|nr:carbon-nitrogen hydrolase [Pseudovirgaria hyperparasitica]KAF2755905.1 carbon-nitrogen hydrolase [Pseudovirgaria hyperparasitica]
MSQIRVAACHLSPIVFSARATTDKCIAAIKTAAKNATGLVVFPESFIPAFPVWSALQAPTDNHDFFRLMTSESVVVSNGKYVDAIREEAKKNGIMVSLGISERLSSRDGTLYNSNLLIGADGGILAHHRKLVPTFFEKLTWAPGDGAGLVVPQTPFGRIGALICGENTNPLARFSLMEQGEQVHISTFPPIWPTRVPSTSASSGKNYDNVAANRTRAAGHCFEAKCFGLVCSGYLDNASIEKISSMSTDQAFMRDALAGSPRAATFFLDPTGAAKNGYTVDNRTGEQKVVEYLRDTENVLYADLDLNETIEGKQYHDVAGGYQRFDVFKFEVNRSRRIGT